MRLSDAIRLGSMLGPQYFGDFYSGAGATCAFGAALEAIDLVFVDSDDVVRQWPWIVQIVPCPCGLCRERLRVVDAVPHLNDDVYWSRERIADWVESLETSAGLQRADGGSTDVVDARAPALNHPSVGDREKEFSGV